MVQELKQSTAVVVHVGPFVDVGDGFTPETGITLSGADEAEVLKQAATTTTSISGLTFAAITSCDGWYALSLGTGETDTLGDLEVIVQDDSVCLPVHVRFSVVTANVWDSRYSTDVLDCSVTQWLGTAAATPTVAGVPEVDVTHMEGGTQTVTDLKDFADAGYDPGTNKVQGVVLVDTTTTNTDMLTAAAVNAEVDTALTDIGLDHIVSASVTGTDITDNSIIASLVSKEVTADWDDFVNTTDSLQAIKDEIGAAVGANISADIAGVQTDTTLILADTADMQPKLGTPAADLAADIAALPTAAGNADAVWDELRNDHRTDNTMGHCLKALAPTDGLVEASGGNSPTQFQSDASETTDDAFNGSIVVMTDAALQGQARLVTDYVGSTGTFTVEPGFTGTPAAGTSWVIVSTGNVNLRTATQTSIDAIETDTADIQPKIGAPAADLAADIAAVKVDTAAVLVDTADMQPKLGSPAADVSADIAAVKVDTAAILVDTGTTLDTKINDIQGATFSSATDSLEAIRDRGDSAWITGAGGSDPFVLQNTTIATLASQVSFTLTAGSADDDAYNGMLAIVEDVSTATQKCVGVISDYTGSTKTITLREDPGIFTMATTDTIDIVVVSPDILDILADTADMQPKLGSPAADVSADIAAVKVDTAAVLVDTADMQPKLGSPAADVSADIAAVKVDTAAVLVDTADMQPKIGSPAADLAADIAAVPTADENADGVLDRANAIETGLTFRQAQRLIAAAVAGKLSGAATTTVTIREAVNDAKARITATVDSDGNRSAITWDVT